MELDRSAADVDAWLDGFRTKSDVLADAAVRELIESKRARGDGVDALEHGGPACRRLLEHTHAVPAWVDFEAMRPGAQLGLRTPAQSALALILGSLMELYAMPGVARVLALGGRLSTQVVARLRDTTTFVLEIAASRGPRPGTLAHRLIVNTRLVHAFVRHGAVAHGWDFAAWGHPANQEDFAATLLVFSHVFLRCLERAGVRATGVEAASVHHLWRWVGHVLGIEPALLTATRAEERVLYAHVARRQLHPSDDSRALAAALLGALDRRAPLFLPATGLAELSRMLIGDPLGDALHLPRSPHWRPLTAGALPLLGVAQRTIERLPFAAAPLEHLGERFARLVHARGLRP
jgi:hypothetical protein